jgi:hypothetical protein
VAYGIIVVLRIIVPLLIWFSPFLITVIAIFLDAIDVEFACRRVLTKKQYQDFDKALDYWWFTNAFVFAVISWPEYRILMLGLFLIRTVADVLFRLTKKRICYFYFPNFFENVFVLILVGRTFWQTQILDKPTVFWSLFVLVCAVKLFQEWFIHVAQYSVEENVLKKKRAWMPE